MAETIEILRYTGDTFEAELLPLRNGKQSFCRDCRAEIRFARTPRGTNMPVSDDNGVWKAHHNVCPYAKPRPPKTDRNIIGPQSNEIIDPLSDL